MTLRQRMQAKEMLAGTFLKTPEVQMIEVLGRSGLDFVCLDAEHSPFDRGRLDACLAVANAMGFPALVRVPAGTPQDILMVMDAGATGIVVPHVDSVAKAEAVAKAARFGHGGRGYAGSTRWANFTTSNMADLLARSRQETVVIAQIEEPEGVDASSEIAAVEGIDGLFAGPADLSVAYGKTDQTSPELMTALETIGAACKAHDKTYMSFVPNAEKAAEWRRFGLTMFFIASEHSWILQGAGRDAKGIHALS